MRFPSPEPIPPSDLALIAAYTAERGVTHCPAGAYSESPFLPLREKIRREAIAGKAKAARDSSREAEDARRRRRSILEMLKAKTPHRDIAAFAGVPVTTIANDAKMLRKEGRL